MNTLRKTVINPFPRLRTSLVPTPTVTPTVTPDPTVTPRPTVAVTLTPSPLVTQAVPAIQKEAWIYPGPPACNAAPEYQSRGIDTLKVEYLTVNSSGGLDTMTEANYGCNGYTPANAAALKNYSREQYVTVSGDIDGILAMINDPALRSSFVAQVAAFVEQTGFTGADIDFEQYDQWSATDYTAYKTMVTLLGNTLHSKGRKLQLDLPPLWNQTVQNYYQLKYQDFNTLPVDQYTIMVYDYMYDYGAGTAIQPITWMNSVIDWAQSKFTDKSKIAIGLPAYGYQGTCGQHNITIDTYDQIKTKPGFNTAVRDGDSQEMRWRSGGICYGYVDGTALDAKLTAAVSKGITQVSVWHLGGNPWF
jgi:hypothetical protein